MRNEQIFDEIIETLLKARESATLERLSIGFPDDKIKVISSHFDGVGKVGSEHHPNDYVKEQLKLHHNTWIIPQLDCAISMLRANEAMISHGEKVGKLVLETSTKIDSDIIANKLL